MDRQIINFNFKLIEDLVVLLYPNSESIITFHQGLHSLIYSGFGMAGHCKQPLFQIVEFEVEVVRHKSILSWLLPKPASDIVLSAFVFRIGENTSRGPELDQFSQIQKRSKVGHSR